MPYTSLRPMIDRRHFIKTIGAGALTAPWHAHAEAGSDVKTISIIHTTDLHGHVLPTSTYGGLTDLGGLARCATLIRQWRKQNPDSLLIDIGDVYQGTRTSHRNQGELMIKLFNKLGYDSWTLGNHEFDWGIEPLQNAVRDSAMPVLTANILLEGKPSGSHQETANPLSKISPFMLKEVGGFKIGVIGAVTPGLQFWLRPEMTKGIVATDPAEPISNAARELKRQGADAIIVSGHMGHRNGRDDFANRVTEVIEKCPDVDVFIGGHTHTDVTSYQVDRTLYTQAGYYGIYLGRVDLAFSSDRRSLVDMRSFTVMMDRRFDLDPVVIDTARTEIEAADAELAKPVGILAQPLSPESEPGKPSDIQKLHAVSIRHRLAKQGVEIDAVLHGQFVREVIPAGQKRLADMWSLAPYENLIVTAELGRSQLIAIAQETCSERNARNLVGLTPVYEGTQVIEINDRDGHPIAPGQRYRIALNSYDSQSGGKRLMKLAEIMNEPSSRSTLHVHETRDALSEFFLDKESVTHDDLAFG